MTEQTTYKPWSKVTYKQWSEEAIRRIVVSEFKAQGMVWRDAEPVGRSQSQPREPKFRTEWAARYWDDDGEEHQSEWFKHRSTADTFANRVVWDYCEIISRQVSGSVVAETLRKASR